MMPMFYFGIFHYHSRASKLYFVGSTTRFDSRSVGRIIIYHKFESICFRLPVAYSRLELSWGVPKMEENGRQSTLDIDDSKTKNRVDRLAYH